MAIAFLKKFWKEIFAVSIIALVLYFALYFFSEPKADADFYSPTLAFASLLLVFIPIVPAVIGGILARRKSENLLELQAVPFLGLALAGLVILLFNFLPILFIGEYEWLTAYVNETPLMELDVSMEQYQLVTYLGIAMEIAKLFLSFIVWGFIGGMIAYHIPEKR